MTAGYDVIAHELGVVRVDHHTGKVETDGPWLILHGEGGQVDVLRPAHMLESVTRCDGTACRAAAWHAAVAQHREGGPTHPDDTARTDENRAPTDADPSDTDP